MSNRFFRALAVALLALAPISAARAQAPRLEWQSVVTGKNLGVTVLEPTGARAEGPLPLVIYLRNLAAPRAGTEGDEPILRDLRAQGHLVAVLDYANQPQSRVPFLNRDLSKLRDDLRANTFLTSYKLDGARVYIVPSGSRLKRDVPFYRDDKKVWAMDIIYPSRPAKPVGTILEFSCDNANRMSNVSLSICSDTILDGQATEGFAVAMADHPVAAPYKGLDPMPDSAFKIKAAVRTLRAQGENLGLNGKIATVGFSRGSGMALMLATTEGLAQFEGKGENLGQSSAIQGAAVMSGRFSYLDLLPTDSMLARYAKAWGEKDKALQTWREAGALDYLSRPTMPLFLTINITESPDALHQMAILRKRLAEVGNDETFLMDREPRGHKVPLVPTILESLNNYFKRQLNG